MTKSIIIAVACGVLSGYLFIPDIVIEYSEYGITVGLCLLLFLVGLDIGRQGSVFQDMKKIGFKVLIIPLAIIVGTLVFSGIAGLLLPLSIKETMAIGAGFGWYSLAPIILADYSAKISAISFLHNIMREVLGLIIIPIVAKKIGYIESVSLPGAAAMDTCLPVIEKATNSSTVIYAFVSGIAITIAVPILVPFIINF